MKGEYGCNTLHPPHIIMGAKSCVLNAMEMTVMNSDANLTTSLIKEGGVHVPTEDITLPFCKEMHTYTYTHRTTRSKIKHLTPQPAHLPKCR